MTRKIKILRKREHYKDRGKHVLFFFLKNYADRGRRHPPQPLALADNKLLKANCIIVQIILSLIPQLLNNLSFFTRLKKHD